MTEQERNKQALRDLLTAADAGDLEQALSFYAPDYEDHDASEARSAGVSPLASLRQAFATFQRSFTGARHCVELVLAEGDLVAALISVEAVHTGEVLGMPASGAVIRNESLVIYRFAAGRIRERWCHERRSTREVLQQARDQTAAASD